MNKTKKFAIYLLAFICLAATAVVFYNLRTSPSYYAAEIRYLTTASTTVPSSEAGAVVEQTTAAAEPLLLDINTATATALMELEGIGEVLAKRIVAYRDEHGPFTSLNQLVQVKGISDALYRKILPFLLLNGVAAAEVPETAATTAAKHTAKPAPVTAAHTTAAHTTTTAAKATTAPPATTKTVTFPIDLNTASVSDLMCLHGIGEALAGRIVAYREAHGVFHSVDELNNVSGIGEKTLANIRNDLYVDPAYALTATEKAVSAPPVTKATATPQDGTSATKVSTVTLPPVIQQVCLNSATLAELMTLPDVDADIGAKILALRGTIGKFTSKEELLYAVSKDVYNAIKGYVYV